MAKNWIQKAIKHPGALHRELHVPMGKDIPQGKLEKAAEKGGKLGRRARLAETLEGFHHGKKASSSKEREAAAGRRGDKKLHEMAMKRHHEKAMYDKYMKEDKKEDRAIYDHIKKHGSESLKRMMRKHLAEEREAMGGRKGDKKLHEMAVKRHEAKKAERKGGIKGDKKLHEMAVKRHKSEKVGEVMDEFKAGKLHSGSRKGPKVTNRRQAMAIALNESKKAGKKRK